MNHINISTFLRFTLLVSFLFIVSCAEQNPNVVPAQDIAGFFAGLWNGFTAWIALAGSIFFDISIYEVSNTGFGYNFGFLFGISIFAAGILEGIAWFLIFLAFSFAAFIFMKIWWVLLIILAVFFIMSKIPRTGFRPLHRRR